MPADLDPIQQVEGLTSAIDPDDVNKGQYIEYEKTNIRAFADPAAVRAAQLDGRSTLFVFSIQTLFRRDPSSTAEDDGLNVIVDGSGIAWLAVGTSPERIAFAANKNAADQAGVLSATITKVTFGTENFDVGSYYDSGTSRFTPPAGKYLIAAQVTLSAGLVDQNTVHIYLYKNGVSYRRKIASQSGTGSNAASIAVIADADGDDYFEIYALGNGTGDKTISGAATDTWFTGSKIDGSNGIDGRGLDFDARGVFADRDDFDGQPEDFAYLSMNGDGALIADAVLFYKESDASGDWSDAVLTRGPIGATGSTGATGAQGNDAGLKFTFNSATSGDPASGKFLWNHATFASATALHISETDGDGNSVSAFLAAIDDSTSTNKALVRFQKNNGTAYFEARLTAVLSDQGAYDTFAISPIGTAGTIANGDVFRLTVAEKGDKGDTGTTGATPWSPPAAWLTATAYVSGPPASVVVTGGETYVCLVSHTSGTFATDLAASKWLKVAAAGVSGTSALTIVRVVATANVTIASALENGDTLDGVTLATNDVVLLTGQTAAAENGVYVVVASGTASRHSSFTTYDTLPGTYFSVMAGTAKADTLWRCTSDRGGTIGSSAVAISEFTAGGQGTYASRGLYCHNNTSTPNTQFDIDVDEVVFRDSAGNTAWASYAGAVITCNISTAGPVANGRDQAGALSSNSVAHFYLLSNGTSSFATTVSASPPPTGPALPTGYNKWAYVAPVRIDGSGNLLHVVVEGHLVHFGSLDVTRPLVLSSGSATSQTAVDVSAFVPPNAYGFWVGVTTWQLTSDASGVANASLLFRTATGVNYLAVNINLSGLANSTIDRLDTGAAMFMPNIGQQFYYLWTVTAGSSPAGSANLYSYSVPNGG